jgi:hypothetical protein
MALRGADYKDEEAYKDKDVEADVESDGKPLLGGGPRSSLSGSMAQLTKLVPMRAGTARVVLAASVSVAWMFFSSVLILLNKHILKDLKFS